MIRLNLKSENNYMRFIFYFYIIKVMISNINLFSLIIFYYFFGKALKYSVSCFRCRNKTMHSHALMERI